MSSNATVTYRGEVHCLDTEHDLLFGRGSGNDLNVEREPDDLVHRRFGRIYFRNGVWWIANDGSRLSLAINDQNSVSSIVLAPGCTAVLSFRQVAIRFSGRTPNYEISIDLGDPGTLSGTPDASESADGAAFGRPTTDQAQMPLVGEQRLLLVALAENKLRNPHEPLALPTNRAVARRFGWSRKTFDGKLGRLAEKFKRWGMTGLVGELAEPATDRRNKLVNYAIDRAIIDVHDLDLLDEYPIT